MSTAIANQNEVEVEVEVRGDEVSQESIDRGELSNRLADLGVTFDEQSFAAATEERARELWQWMEMNADFVDSENPKGDWLAVLPEGFMAASDGDQCVVKLVDGGEKKEPQKVTAEKHLELIKEVSGTANRLRAKLQECESDEKAAKARTKEARENLDRAEIELSAVIEDARSGQQRLPFEDKTESATDGSPAIATATTNDSSPISELGIKQIKKLIGGVEFDRLKSIDEPVGLSDSVLEKLEQAELATIGDLEKLMQENQYWWERANIAKDGHAQCVQRVISTLLAYRKVNPVAAASASE